MTLAHDTDPPPLDADHLNQRLADWRKRVADLLEQLTDWGSQEGYIVRSGPPITMNEQLMRENGIEAMELPTLEIGNNAGFVAKVIPYGLWIIGGNGRVDLKTSQGVFKIIDLAANFEEPRWKIGGPNVRSGPDLDREVFLSVLSGG